jgi:Xaa-Pro aminopeptidase
MFSIPDEEYRERMLRFQANIREAGVDAALVHSNEADFANVRFLTEYWPTFEAAGVFVPGEGEPVLIIGPESEAYAEMRSRVPLIHKMVEYRESAEPEYPGIPVSTFRDVIQAAMPGREVKKLGLVGYSILPMPVYMSLREQLPDTELVKADDTLINLRIIKSDNELNLLRKAFEVSEKAIDAILDEIVPGMTELQVIGIAQREIYRHGGEYEGHALYCFCGPGTKHAISRPTHNRIIENEMIQLNIGARVGGYASSVGLPFSIGPLPDHKKRLLEFGLEAHHKTIELLDAGKPAAQVVQEYESFVRDGGFGQNMLYGPCHGLGMMEVERPWMESTSTYALEENMTFQVDTFFQGEDFGLRWENGVRIAESGVEKFSEKYMKIVEI